VRPFFLVIFFWTLERLCAILNGFRMDDGRNRTEFNVGPTTFSIKCFSYFVFRVNFRVYLLALAVRLR